MEFKDWRKTPEQPQAEGAAARKRTKNYSDYIEELIQEAEKRGEFADLPGAGKPLRLDDDSAAGDKALAYRMLKKNGYAPKEIELGKEIDAERQRAEAALNKVIHEGKALHGRRLAPFASERRAFNRRREKALKEYEETLRDLNRKILTLNLIVPPQMHRAFIEVERLIQQIREECPPFEV